MKLRKIVDSSDVTVGYYVSFYSLVTLFISYALLYSHLNSVPKRVDIIAKVDGLELGNQHETKVSFFANIGYVLQSKFNILPGIIIRYFFLFLHVHLIYF